MPDFDMDDLEALAIGRAKRTGQEIEFVRELTPGDLALLLDGARGTYVVPSRVTIRHSHHQLARLVVTGVSNEEAAYITGYNPAYISQLRNDPAFCELMAHYGAMVEQQFVDVHARLSILGMDTIEELAERMRLNPASFTVPQLLAMAEFAFDRSSAPAKGGPKARGGNAAGIAINVHFNKPEDSIGTTIDVTPEKPT